MHKALSALMDLLPISHQEKDENMNIILQDIDIPAKIIGIGQCGVGKTELLRSIFKISDSSIEDYLKFKGEREEDYSKLLTGSVKAVTKQFFTFTVKNPDGFSVQFTDGPGLGESTALDQNCISKWVEEIPKHDLLYWVLDASSRDIAHIQLNIKKILDETGFRNRFVVVLNKVDQILIPLDLELKGVVGWNIDFNCPSKALEKLIQERTGDIIDKLVEHIDISKNQIVTCSARRRWNHGSVFDRFLEYLPSDKKIKVSTCREIKDYTELMTDEGKSSVVNKE
jgi:predicted GTPase